MTPAKATHQKETKSGVSSASVCASMCEGKDDNTLLLCFPLSGNEIPDSESHAQVIFVSCTFGRLVRGRRHQWSDCDSCCFSSNSGDL